ncbi:hypothetical protein Y032_0008g329 [Ancylostoma ceylanicum]|uniref:Uncharacterized protein n=1 Tax=Ancylostoma ceylanicum TaxID=53326 RepID=A0A016VM65_9BILA|nr:hypothetical protein Y032_0008g329 [Ancylostoma ceylanicum]
MKEHFGTQIQTIQCQHERQTSITTPGYVYTVTCLRINGSKLGKHQSMQMRIRMCYIACANLCNVSYRSRQLTCANSVTEKIHFDGLAER